MSRHLLRQVFALCLMLASGLHSSAQSVHRFDIQTAKPGAVVQPTMYGVFFEDINYGADGGLYAELVKNRSFEFTQPLMGWNVAGKVEVFETGGPFPRNPQFVRMSYSGHEAKRTALENEGFFGIAVCKGDKYHFSVWSRRLQTFILASSVSLEAA